MPYEVEDDLYYDIVSFGDTIICFYFGDSGQFDILCLDLLCYQWFKSKVCVPNSIDWFAHCIKTIDDYIHILHKDHFKLNVYELFPNDMVVSRRKHYNKLVMGYIKQEENKHMISNVPCVLKQLILLYFQLFG
eukprot:248595_1